MSSRICVSSFWKVMPECVFDDPADILFAEMDGVCHIGEICGLVVLFQIVQDLLKLLFRPGRL